MRVVSAMIMAAILIVFPKECVSTEANIIDKVIAENDYIEDCKNDIEEYYNTHYGDLRFMAKDKMNDLDDICFLSVMQIALIRLRASCLCMKQEYVALAVFNGNYLRLKGKIYVFKGEVLMEQNAVELETADHEYLSVCMKPIAHLEELLRLYEEVFDEEVFDQ